jgi:twitching motility protein PilT
MLTMSTGTPQDTFASATIEPPVAPPPAQQLGGSVAPVAAREPVINAMFRRMFELKASDLHLSATTAPLVRKDGEMRLLHEAAGPLTSEMILRMLSEIMPAINRAEFEA